jgi:hypothetical protein
MDNRDLLSCERAFGEGGGKPVFGGGNNSNLASIAEHNPMAWVNRLETCV